MKAGDIVTGQYGSYQVLEQVGRGAHATVYKALSLTTQGIVALKCLYANSWTCGSHRDTAQARWAAEVDALRAVAEDTRHIIAYVDHMQLVYRTPSSEGNKGEEEETVYCIVEEYAAAGSLLQWRRQHAAATLLTQPSTSDETSALARAEEMLTVTSMIYGVTCALATLQKCGVVHGDVKCANVLLTSASSSSGVAKLADFSLATRVNIDEKTATNNDSSNRGAAGVHERSFRYEDSTSPVSADLASSHAATAPQDSHTLTSVDAKTEVEEEEGNALGSIYWLAPEVARGGCDATHTHTPSAPYRPHTSSDVWSLGCLAIELLTGKPPFAEYSAMHALYQIAHITEPVPLPLGLSAAAEDFIRSCLSVDPLKRPTAAELCKHRWLTDARIHAELDALVYTEPSQPLGASDAIGTTATILTSTHTTPMLPSPPRTSPATTIDGLAAWVEHHLFSNSLDVWLKQRGVLAKLVAVLARITAEESFSIVRSLAYAAARCCAVMTNTGSSSAMYSAGSWQPCAFLDELGQTTLWEHDNLPVLCTAEDLVTLFRCCCAGQSATVPAYAPTHVRALRFLLLESPDRALTAPRALDALYKLFVPTAAGDDNEEDEDNNKKSSNSTKEFTSMNNTAATNTTTMMTSRAEQRRVGLQRLRREGGFALLRRVVERVCSRAFIEAAEPALGWQGVDHLLAILHAAAAGVDLSGEDDEVNLLLCQRPPRTLLSTHDSPSLGFHTNKEREREEERVTEGIRRDFVMLPPPSSASSPKVKVMDSNDDDNDTASSTQSQHHELDITHRPESSAQLARQRKQRLQGSSNSDTSGKEGAGDVVPPQPQAHSGHTSLPAGSPQVPYVPEQQQQPNTAGGFVRTFTEQLYGTAEDYLGKASAMSEDDRYNVNVEEGSSSSEEDEEGSTDSDEGAGMMSHMPGTSFHRPTAAQRWLLTLQECSAHGGPHATVLFLHYIQHAAEHGCNEWLRDAAGVSATGTLLLIASEPTSTHTTLTQRLQILDCLVALQRISLPARRFIRDRNASVPLLAYILESAASEASNISIPNATNMQGKSESDTLAVTRNASDAARLQKACVAAVRMLCDGDEQMAASCATSQAFLKAVWAALCATAPEDEDAMAQILSLLELLCAHAEQRGRGRLGVTGNAAVAGANIPTLVPSLQDNKGIAVLERLARSAEQRSSGLVTAAQKLLSVLGVLPHAV